MNFSLHLQTIFTFVRQNNFKEKNPIHIYKNCTRHCLFMYLNSTTVDLFWPKGVLETVHAHIHIYIYQGPWSCQVLQKQVFFCLFHAVVIFPSCAMSGRSAPLLQPHHSLSAAQLLSFTFRMLHWVGNINTWMQACIRNASAVSIYTHKPLSVVRWMVGLKDSCWSNIYKDRCDGVLHTINKASGRGIAS